MSVPPRPSSGQPPTVSVVMPTYNRLPGLRQALEALAVQTYPRRCYEIVVVSDGSTDGTDAYLENGTPVPVVFAAQPNAGPAAARNRGVDMARGDLILFIDDDVMAAPELVEQHVAAHRRDGDGLVVIGPMLTPPDTDLAPWVRWEQTMLYRQYQAMADGVYPPTPRQFYTGNASVARASISAVGGFDTSFRRAEDIELAYRLEAAGLRFAFNPDAKGYHYADRTFDSWLRIAHDYGVSDAVFARDHGRASVWEIIREGYQRRPAPARWMILASLAHPWLDAAIRNSFTQAYRMSRLAGSERVTRYALSGVYNTAYYRGLADELGGPREFRVAVGAGDQ